MDSLITVDHKEIYRYLGYGANSPGEEVRQAVEECLALLIPEIEKRQIHRSFRVKLHSDGNEDSSADGNEDRNAAGITEIEGMRIQSRALAKNLSGCTEVCLMAATIGFAPDRLASRAAAAGKVSRSVMFQAAGTALIEAWRGEVFRMIREEYAEKGLFPRPGISPGYGDFALEYQQDLMRILNVQKTIGVTLTEHLMMMPTKSVTALIGLGKEDNNCAADGCEICSRSRDCRYRRY